MILIEEVTLFNIRQDYCYYLLTPATISIHVGTVMMLMIGVDRLLSIAIPLR